VRRLSVGTALVLVFAIAEVTLFVLVAQWIGLLTAIVLALLTTLLGGVLVVREGKRGWQRLRAAALERRPPGAEATDGLIGLLGALLLVVPGFLTDVLGLLLLTPPARAAVRASLRRATERRVPAGVAGDLFGPRRVRVRRNPSGTPEPETGRISDNPVMPESAASSTDAPRSTRPAGAPDVVDGDVIEGEIVDPR
jgi:UPF0716 protein FxsA